MDRFFLSFVFITLLSAAVFAQEAAPKLSFGTIQPDRGATTYPGSTLKFDVYFFIDEAYGTRAAHITISPALVPQDWLVSVDPPLNDVTLNISGVVVSGSENLNVDPRPLLSAVPETSESGIYYIASPSGKGYLQAKKATIQVEIPDNAEIGKTFDLSMTGTAKYYGSAGAVLFTQSRGFSYQITVIAPTYSEQVITQPAANESALNTTEGSEGNKSSSVTVSQNTVISQGGFSTEQVLIIVVVAVVAVLAVTKLPGMMGSGKN
ncbi:Uncharacterised protein [uncultured archaeon]|nr:Uncharacterised protein [uncultured archaeon]